MPTKPTATKSKVAPLELVVAPPTALAVVTAVTKDFDDARKFLRAAQVSAAQSAAFMCLCGVELERLHKLHGIKRGRPDKSRNVAGIKWPELVQREMGISEDTAWRYIEMARAAKKRLPHFDANELLTTPLNALPEARREKLVNAVQKLTDGQTAQQLMFDWGIAKKPHGHGLLRANAGGSGHGKAKKLTPEEELEIVRAAAEANFNALLAELKTAIRESSWEHWPKEKAADQKKLRELADCVEDLVHGFGPLLERKRPVLTFA